MNTVVTGPALVAGELVIPIWRAVSLIGRIDPLTNESPDVDLTSLDDRRSVSRRHARLDCSSRTVMIRDLGSTNGTFVNEEPLPAQADRELRDGDALRFGRVEMMYTTTAGWPDGVVAEWDSGTLQMTKREKIPADGGRKAQAAEARRLLATVMFTDIADSTVRAATLGDRDWRDLLLAHRQIVRWQLGRFEGREIQTTGDGFLAIFESPGHGVRCGCAITDEVRTLGIEVRVGLHTGECEISGDDLAGIAVHIAARVAGKASGGEVMVSATVRDLVVGSGLPFVDRGLRGLKASPGSGGSTLSTRRRSRRSGLSHPADRADQLPIHRLISPR